MPGASERAKASDMAIDLNLGTGQGSLWRRWDPHVHLPGTLLNDQFKGMSIEDALEALANTSPPVEVIGVTDYFTTDSYRRAATALESGIAPTIQLAFPNVELRLDNATSSNHGVNIHLLCPPEEVDGLDQFIGRLEFSWADKPYRADRNGLIQLGRDFSGNPDLDEAKALRAGVNQFKVNFEDLRRALRADRWAREHVLVAVAGGERDGSSGIRDAKGAFVARRQSIEAIAAIVFSSNPKQAQHWLGEGKANEQELESIYGGVKLCLHGSDAHEAGRLGAPDNDRLCWLKGDPTFDTLKLACLTPSTRSHIGPEPPVASNPHGRIVRLDVSSSDWFVNGSLALNPGLVAIIGARGSGKTALADLVAAGAGSTEPFDNEYSFVSRADELLHNSVAAVEWSHGDLTTCNFASPQTTESFVRPVRYLSQQFVDRLCASDGVSDELLTEIERVIFEAWPVDERQGATTFRELLNIRLTATQERQAAELQAVLELSDQITEIRLRRGALPSKRDELKQRKKKLETLEKEIKKLTEKADKKSADRLGEVSTALRKRQEELQQLNRRKTGLEDLESAIQTARTINFPRHLEQLRDAHQAAKLDDSEWDAFAIDFKGDVDSILSEASKALASRINTTSGPHIDDPESIFLDALLPDGLLECSVNELKADVNRLQGLVGLDKARSKDLKKLTEAADDAHTRIKRLQQNIERDEGKQPDDLVIRRLQHYEAYFEALLEEESELRELYAPLDSVLRDFGASVAKLRFVVRRVVDVEAWAKQGEDLLDLRKEGRFRGEGELAQVAQDELVSAWETGGAQEAAIAINGFVTKHSDDLRNQRPSRIDSPEAIGKWQRSISRWLYRTDHIQLRYSLEYDGLNIERLSPGTRGIVLLLLYLAVDQQESDPLIIDQPEENLDPESVYSELVKLFRSASQRRQIIMVTHNANLVVNTDVDQVIIAHCGSLEEGRLPELSYAAGGLEDPQIRRSVCEVLEGGAEAFRQRAKRLGLDLSLIPTEAEEQEAAQTEADPAESDEAA